MQNRETYKIRLVPVDGPTMLNRTETEWSLGYLFKVIWSDSPLFSGGSRITVAELDAQEQYHPVRFIPQFEYLTLAEYIQQQAGEDGMTNWGYHKAVKLLTKGQ
tara:strand:+ start:919 stop:1230 length:312 start_codon:yes stop_codon:yes gene_type:complete